MEHGRFRPNVVEFRCKVKAQSKGSQTVGNTDMA